MGILDRSALNHIDFSAEDTFQAEFEFEIPIEKGMVSIKFNEYIDIT